MSQNIAGNLVLSPFFSILVFSYGKRDKSIEDIVRLVDQRNDPARIKTRTQELNGRLFVQMAGVLRVVEVPGFILQTYLRNTAQALTK